MKNNRNFFTLQLTKIVKLICIKGRYVKVDTKTFLHASHVVCLIENKSALTFDAGVSKATMSIVMRVIKSILIDQILICCQNTVGLRTYEICYKNEFDIHWQKY